MTRYEVQYELPVNNPLMNVAKRKHKRGTTFYVPVNHPNAHSMGYAELIEACETSGLVRVINKP